MELEILVGIWILLLACFAVQASDYYVILQQFKTYLNFKT